MYKRYYDRLLQQISIDFNCTPENLRTNKVTITKPALNDGRRSYSPDMPFLDMATLGQNTVIMADERLHEFLRSLITEEDSHHLFELDNLLKINEEIKKYGYQMHNTHHMFLPCCEKTVEERFQVKWLYDSDINRFYKDERFPNAIAYPEPCPVRPDRIIVMAMDGDTIMGMAGCSEDAPHWQQIGIDVLPEYRSKGIGSYLVTLLRNKIIEMGDVPFYGTAAANIQSQNIAVNSGFKHAWVETEASKIKDEERI